MTIRDREQETLKASPLNSRGVRCTPGWQSTAASTLKGSPISCGGAPLQGACILSSAIRRSFFDKRSDFVDYRPTAIER